MKLRSAVALVAITSSGIAFIPATLPAAAVGAAGLSPATAVTAHGWSAVPAAARKPVIAAVARATAPHHRSPVERASFRAAGGQAKDEFGFSVAVSGSTVVVGAPHRRVNGTVGRGAAYVFRRPSSAGWNRIRQVAVLTAPASGKNSGFGYSVAVSGTGIVVGAPLHHLSSNKLQGAAYVFNRPSGGWHNSHPSATLVPRDGFAGDEFGRSVAMSGRVAVVGSPRHLVGAISAEGAAYVFTRPSAGWFGQVSPTAELTPDQFDSSSGANMGTMVAISGNTIVAGAPYFHTVAGPAGQGAAYVFVKPGSGWRHATEAAVLTARKGAANNYFGDSVAISGGTIVAGAPDRTVGGNLQAGAAYVFLRPVLGWSRADHQNALLTVAPGGRAHAFFGVGVAVSGGTVLVNGSGVDAVFYSSNAGWSGVQHQHSAINGAVIFNDLSSAVAMSGRTIVAGAPTDPVGGHRAQGVAYVFVR